MINNRKIQISEEEFIFKASRSRGPGGQNVNKLNTKIALVFNVENSTSLTAQQKNVILKKLASKITNQGKLLITSEKFRTQNANKNAAKEKLYALIEKALRKPKKRRPTKPTRASVEKRLKTKKLKSATKQLRKPVSAQ